MFKSLNFFMVVSGIFLFSGLPLYARTMQQKDTTLVQKKLQYECVQQRVHRVGGVNFCVTNWGFLGSKAREEHESPGGCFNPYPNQYNPAPSFEFPKGSDLEYLFQGAIWVGGVVEGETLVSVGADGWLLVNEMYPDAAPNGCITEKSVYLNTPNCSPPDTAGAVSEQDIIAIYSDTNTVLPDSDGYDSRPHKPLNIKVIQKSHSWSGTGFDRFIITDYYILNLGTHNIDSAYVGFLYDGDVMHIDNNIGFYDDITGFKPFYVSPANETTEVNLAWLADNNGDPSAGNWNYKSVTGATALVMLDSSNPDLKYSYNWWVSEGNDPVNLDWGPHKLSNWDIWINNYGVWCEGGKGTPCGDRAKYFLMSNGEIDYDQIYSCIDKTAEGWLPPPGFCVDLADGYDVRYLFSFGPFELLSQDTLHFTVAFIAGDSFHIYANNPIDPYNPDTFYSKLNFSDLAQNAIRAESLYKCEYKPICVPPPKPFNVRIKNLREGTVLLTWTKVEKGYVTGYNIYRSIQRGVYNDPPVFYAQPAETISYVDSGLVTGQVYYYTVSALNSIGESGKSDEVRIVVGAPQVTPQLQKVLDKGDGHTLHLEWYAQQDSTVTGFKIHYGTTSGIYTQVADAGYTFNYDLTGLGTDITYYISLAAYNQALIEGLRSDEVSGVPHSRPSYPTGFVAQPGNKRIDLYWNSNKELDLAGYRISRWTYYGEPKHLIAFVPASTSFYSDTTVYNDSIYLYYLAAVDQDSNASIEAGSGSVKPGITQIGNLSFGTYVYNFGWGYSQSPGAYLWISFSVQNLGNQYLLDPKAIAHTDDPCIYSAYIESDTLYGESASPYSTVKFYYHPVRGGRYWQRYLVMIKSDCPSGDTVYIPLDFYDDLNTYLGSDTIAFQVTGTDSTPPRVVQVDCHPQTSTGTDTIMALIEDGADIKEAFALIKNGLNDSLIASVPLQDDGLNGDLQVGDRIFSGIYNGIAIGDFYVDIDATDIYDNSLICKQLAGFSTKPFQKNNSLLFYHRYGRGHFSRWLLSGNALNAIGIILEPNSREHWLSTLDSLGSGYDFWDEFYRGEVPSNILLSYAPEGEVIYADDYGDLSQNSQNNLIDLLSNYGKLILASGWLGQELDSTAFYNQYLHARLVSTPFDFLTGAVFGIPQEEMFSGFFFPFIAYGYCEEIDPIPPATTILKYNGSGYQSSGSAAIKYTIQGSDDSSRAIYYAFNWAKLSNQERYRLLERSVNWLKTGVEEENIPQVNLPDRFSLSQNYPNPFNPNTLIEYALPQASLVKLVIYNILGQKVKVLVDEYQKPGYKRILWDGKNGQGQMVSSGIYFYQLKAGEQVFTKKMIMVK